MIRPAPRGPRTTWALAVGLAAGMAGAATDPSFVSFDGGRLVDRPSGLLVERLAGAGGVRVRNEKHGFRLNLPDSHWTFRTDRKPLEVTDTRYFVSVERVPAGGSERRHLGRVLKRLKREPNLVVGEPEIENLGGKPILRYYSKTLGGSAARPTSLVEWNYRTCIDVPPARFELHVVRSGATSEAVHARDPWIARIIDSFARVPPRKTETPGRETVAR